MKYSIEENLKQLSLPKIGEFDWSEGARQLFRFLKDASTNEALWARAIPFQKEEFSSFRLVPVAKYFLDDAVAISELAEWRNQTFAVQMPHNRTDEVRTKEWLKNLVQETPNRILFFVTDKHGRRLGHIGLWIKEDGRVELDNVIKAPSTLTKGLFTAATVSLGLWTYEFLGIGELQLRVLQSNIHALKFYEKIGFSIDTIQHLTVVTTAKDTELVPSDTPSDNAWVHMSVELENFTSTDDHILTAGPSIGPFEISLVTEAVKSGWKHHNADFLKAFSEEFASYVGSRYALPTDCCTSALHLSLWALGIGPGDEVIVPEITWVSTATAVRFVGATPVFADIDPQTWCMDVASVESLVTNKTKAIIPVHLYGFVANLSELKDLCGRKGLSMVQDAAPGIGSMFQGEGVAKYGDISCFSFQGAKLLVSGEGGVLTTDDEELYEKAFKIATSGRKPGTFWIESRGKKMARSNLTASLALGQLQTVERQIEKKRRISSWYQEALGDLEGISFQQEAPNTRSIAWMTSIHVNRSNFDREAFRKELLDKKIETRPVFSPISRYPIWEEISVGLPNASYIGDNAINLPSGVNLSRDAVYRVAKAVREILANTK
jgi:perosamine synthetase